METHSPLSDKDAPLISAFVRTGRPHVRVSAAGLQVLEQFKERLRAGEYELHERGCVCGAAPDNSVLVAAEDRYGLPFRTYLCLKCALLFTTPRMTPESVAKFYEREYRPIYRGSRKASASFFDNQVLHGRQILKRVSYSVGKIENKSVFDIGCGAGGVLVPFKDHGWRCHGCDFNPDYLERGKQAGLTLESGSYHTLEQYKPGGLVVASHVLEHCLDPVAELKGWASLLGEHGVIYIEVPGVFNVFHDYKSLGALFHVAHTFNFTLETLSVVASQAGLRRVVGNESVWAIFEKGGEPIEVSPKTTKTIEEFLSQPNTAWKKALREIRRHSLRLARSGAKRLPFKGR